MPVFHDGVRGTNAAHGSKKSPTNGAKPVSSKPWPVVMGDTEMKAMVLKKFGGPDSFELQHVAVPEVGVGELLVRVIATAVNPLDYQIRRGDYPDHVPLPAITGHDVSGVVEQVGTGVTDFEVRDKVFYTPRIFDT